MPDYVPVGASHDVGTFNDWDEAFDATEDPANREAAVDAMALAAASQYRCDICPPPDNQHCARDVWWWGDPDELDFDVVDNNDGTFTGTLLVTEAYPYTVCCLACPNTF